MPRLDDSTRLHHILDSARKAVQFIQGRSRNDLDTDDMLCLALIRLLEIMGEASIKVSEEFRAKHPRIAWSKMAGMRNRLIHGYFDVDPDLVWQTVISDLPPVIRQLEKVMGKESR